MKRIPLAGLVCLAWVSSAAVFAQDKPAYTRTEDVIYGRKFGLALTLDVIEPAKKNGVAILWMVSGGWRSAHEDIKPALFTPLLERGYTVFAIVHGSNPRFTIPEVEADVQRAVRFVRHNAARWGVDPARLGISGASAGGHLSLSLATQGKAGAPSAPDPIDRESSALQAVACFFPPSDFLNWSKPGEQRPVPPDVIATFGPRWAANDERENYGREISPAYFVTAAMPPTLVFHGEADPRVPLFQSQQLQRRCQEAGVPFKLVVRPGNTHGYSGWEKDLTLCADWFDEHLFGPTVK